MVGGVSLATLSCAPFTFKLFLMWLVERCSHGKYTSLNKFHPVALRRF